GTEKEERCHPGFRLFGTCATDPPRDDDGDDGGTARRRRRRGGAIPSAGTGGRRVLHPHLWRPVHVDPLPREELREVGRRLRPDLPPSVADAGLEALRMLDGTDGRGDASEEADGAPRPKQVDEDLLGRGSRRPSAREYVKLLSRISSAVAFEPGCDRATESQRLTCLAETVDVFAASCPCPAHRRDFVQRVAAPAWGLSADAAIRHVEGRVPAVERRGRRVEVGRARLPAAALEDGGGVGGRDPSAPGAKRNFAETNHARRLMESVAVCAAQNEPALLVGETGCGKTTLVQRLADLTGRSLLVQNLSLQTDSTDLLGGYKPLEIRHVARKVYSKFVDLFVSSFSRSQNAQFLKYVLTSFEKGDWKRLAQCFLKAARMGENKMRELSKNGKEATHLESWIDFRSDAEHFDRQRLASESGLAFLFTEGALVDAIRTGKWVLLDEINLASSETLQRLCGLLDDSHGSITLTEKGDAEAVARHPDFRLFAAMNPATDAGKKDLPSSIRSRFTEIYVDELVDPLQLRSVAARYLDGAVVANGAPLEHSESVMASVDTYLQCRLLAEQSLVDGGGQKPRFTLRTLCRTLSAARSLIIQQRFAPQRAILEGFQLAFEGSLDLPSRSIIQKQFTAFMPKGVSHQERDHPGRRPEGKKGSDSYLLIKPFWIKTGRQERVDWSEPSSSSHGKPKFVLTQSATSNLRRLCQAVASGPWSVLLEGPTSAGKTTLVEYLAARCGHRCVRINNHEHTDIQEYTGSYAADSNGKISFQEGILVQALRKGHWVILDELNLAPSEVLEALNRLLDDNRELYLPEINEVIKPHENFRLFATQNPAGAYGGRKPLSRAFRNRFVEIHTSDIPEDEMITILERRCGCPPSHAKLLVKVMKSLRQRRSRTGIFRGKDGLITPRDLLRWAGRGASTKTELAMEGYMLLAERLRVDEEKDAVRSVIEKEIKVTINIDEMYYGDKSDGRVLLQQALGQKSSLRTMGLSAIAPTSTIMRLLTLVMRCIKQKEPVLLVGDTGCGKTTVVQLLSVILQQNLTVVNCHATTETSDLLGGFRPVRGRQNIARAIVDKAAGLIRTWSDSSFNIHESAPSFILQDKQLQNIPSDAPKQVFEFLSQLVNKCRGKNEPISTHDKKKRRKLSNGEPGSAPNSHRPDPSHCQLVEDTFIEVEHLHQNYTALFEWADGPLVRSMKDGDLLLLDEMSLAEDAVLERLNSVLEPSRTLTLAEKGGEGPTCVHETDNVAAETLSSEIRANDDFRIFATMNPGGDFGKRELSPALRSRFTEIWVPPVSHRTDIDLVLEQAFSSYDSSGLEGTREMMLDYWQWFNETICDDSFCNDLKLSLRDILSWAKFIAEVSLENKTVEIHPAYLHGASLMHLDGLGLGTGLSNHDASATRNKAKEFLLSQLSGKAVSVTGFQDELEGIEQSMVSTEEYFGIQPFTIPRGIEQTPSDIGFNMTAPTTGLNLRRVLRGMQISKPILLEGSPGVGKTSLISALAKASGHHLVRINLSEQTDMSDLMGSDLPYSGEAGAEDSSPSMSFQWCDGVLLKAIKRGDWVLLDELNLASQSVLEGLNSCLDHRASVYIPELGQTFACPPTFRIFAAQNPLAQGGGRKGLPKSFLNRFTKVYIEALTRDDLFSIVRAQFTSIPTDIVQSMVSFNEGVQSDIVDSRLYGQHGSPWEFNLRDIFRWCQLLISDGGDISSASVAKYGDILYTQRLRTDNDRESIKNRFQDHFGSAPRKQHEKPTLQVKENCVLIGTTSLERAQGTSHWSDIPSQDSEPNVALSLLRPMEAVASCVRMNWPCLLVGPASSGKSAVLKLLAEASNVHLETLAMTSSTDVTELIGCFEQTDALGSLKQVLKYLKQIYDGSCLAGRVDIGTLRSINKYYWDVTEGVSKLERTKSLLVVNKELTLVSAIEKLVGCYVGVAQLIPEFSASFSDQIEWTRRWLSSLKRNSSSSKAVLSPFQWVDGILVQAMERGYWLHLENVNFCPSSVLDRLNPLMEFGGELIMTECGVSDEDNNAKPRVIKPHPNFRLFLSMDPSSHGEVSRAMRNRCIEVCVLPPALLDAFHAKPGHAGETIDAFTALWDSRVRSHNTGNCMLLAHRDDQQRSMELQEEPHSTKKALKEWGALFVALLKRGMARSSLNISQEVLYESRESDKCQRASAQTRFGLVPAILSRRHLGVNPPAACITQGSRFLKAIHAMPSKDQTLTFLKELLSMIAQSCAPYNLDDHEHANSKLHFHAICRLVEMTHEQLPSFFDGFCTKASSQVKFALLIAKNNMSPSRGNCFGGGGTSQTAAQLASRLPHLLEESVTYHQLCQTSDVPVSNKTSVIAVSYFMDRKRINTTHVTCPVTPLLFPFFHTLDIYLARHSLQEVSAYGHLLSCRDRLWQCLKRTQFVGSGPNSQMGFAFPGFFTQWIWLKKSFTRFMQCVEEGIDPYLKRLLVSFETIDESIEECAGGSISPSNGLWKEGGHPRLPFSVHNFEQLRRLKDLSNECTLETDDWFGFTKTISSPTLSGGVALQHLISTNHPTLFAGLRFSRELLGALSMTFWASSDETKGPRGTNYSASDAPKVLRKHFQDSKADFVANLHLATIDTSIQTVENTLDMDCIKELIDETSQKQKGDEFLNNLILRFSEIQATQIGEIMCISDEASMVGILSEALMKQHEHPGSNGLAERLRAHRHEVKSFISQALVHTLWPISDLRPYQTLLWALESDSTTDDVLLQLLLSILPRMRFSFGNHQWCNVYNDLRSISSHLMGPSLWNEEDGETPRQTNLSLLGKSTENAILASSAGPMRIEMNVDRAAVFHLLRLPASSSTPYLTMENYQARRNQAKKLLPLFASQRSRNSFARQAETIKHLLGTVFDAFRMELGQAHAHSKSLLESNGMKASDIAAVFEGCKSKGLTDHVDKLVVPLIQNIQVINESEEQSPIWKRHIARAWICLGLLRLNLLVPSSPIDPGMKPAAKVMQLEWFMREISSNLLSHSLHEGLSYGDFDPKSPLIDQLVALREVALTKRASQKKKIIERPPNAPPFHDLYREIHRFCKTVANVSNVLTLADSIESGDRASNHRSQEVNWQCSAASFCTRLSTTYWMYEDVTIPCVNEIRAIQQGLRGLMFNAVEPPQTWSIVKRQDELLEYPFRNDVFSHDLTKESYSEAMEELLLCFGVSERGSTKQDSGAMHRSIQMAGLVRYQISQSTSRSPLVSGDDLLNINSIFASLAHLPDATVAQEQKASTSNVLDEEEAHEKEFREYFPDHSTEFEQLVSSEHDSVDGDRIDANPNDEDCDDAAEVSTLSEAELSLVVSLHNEIFSGKREKIDDNARIRAFVMSYEAASHLGHLTQWMKRTQGSESYLGSHLMALALRCDVNRSAWSSRLEKAAPQSSPPTNSIRDFHGDPFPAETSRADLPLRNLLIRVGQLLRAFPGHAILLALGQVVERVRQLDIQVVSLGKALAGLEVILRKAQEWEQHASKHVSLGKTLKDISSLVASWRKLELQSWSHLLSMRENRISMRAKRHWPRLYRLVHTLGQSKGLSATDGTRLAKHSSSPSWVWKGHQNISKRLGADVDAISDSIDDMAKAMDAFILTSNIAEFPARLSLIESFANELRNECNADGPKRLPMVRLLQSLCNYYSRLAPLLTRTKDKLREPIEKRLKDEVKLAKWDEQSYYSLAASSEKNHRKLMKLLRDYDKALDTTVLSVLERNFSEGVRSSDQTQAGNNEPVTTVPGDSSLFPKICQSGSKDKTGIVTQSNTQSVLSLQDGGAKDTTPDDWLAAGLTGSADKFVLRMSHYCRRMKAIIPRNAPSAHNASIIAAEMSESIFSRIATLREPKVTRQMKQRALVDLFKSLKEQGYSSLKWAVPSNLRAPHHMLQLPIPSFDDASIWGKSAPVALEEGESYFHRCNVEITRLRFEISMLGSQHMSQREMSLMQGYSEYMLFMICQQRCMIADMIHSMRTIESSVQSFDNIADGMPSGQTELSNIIIRFERTLSSLIEGLRQVALLMKELTPLVDNDTDRGHIHDTVAILSSCADTLEESYIPRAGKMPITYADIQRIGTNVATDLCEAKSKILSSIQSCSNIVPATIFDSCLNDLISAQSLAFSFKDHKNAEGSGVASLSADSIMQLISSLVQSTLIAVQPIGTAKDDEAVPIHEVSASTSPGSPLCESHKEMLDSWDNMRLDKISHGLSELSGALTSLHDTPSTDHFARSFCTRTAVDSLALVHNAMQLSKARLCDALTFFCEHSKLLYILVRVFRVLVSKGFCSDDVSDGGDGDGEGGAGEMKFEDDVDGTGMGEGDGKKDVTEELENEEQLLGLKGDDNQEASSSQEKKELKEDEVDTGMEMEADFEGEKYDLPDQPDDKNDDGDSENEEELDREMGDDEDPNEQIVDEKMWDNDEDSLQELQQENEKFQDDSKMAGEQIEDEMHTGDGDDEGGAKDDPEEKKMPGQENMPQDEGIDQEDEGVDQSDDTINDDTEDKYEDKHGVDVRNDDQNASAEDNDDDVDLNDLNLDDDDDDGDSIDSQSNASDDEEIDDGNPDEKDANDEDNIAGARDANDDQELEEPDTMDNVGDGGAGVDENEGPNEPDEGKNEDTSITPPPKSHYESNEALGVAAKDGQDAVKESSEEIPDPEETANEGLAAEENVGVDEKANDESKGAGGSGNDGNWQRGEDPEQSSESQSKAFDDIPNPFRSPGDAQKFWHKKLDVIQDSQQDQETSSENVPQESHDKLDDSDGKFEYTREGEDNSGQVLGIAEEDQAKQLEDNRDDDFDPSQQDESDHKGPEMDGTENKQKKYDQTHDSHSNPDKENVDRNNDDRVSDEQERQGTSSDDQNQEREGQEENSINGVANRATADNNQLQGFDSDSGSNQESDGEIMEVDIAGGTTLEDLQEARACWQALQSDTNNLSRRLCEKLRLVMEPLVATKLRGDYRTGKRVNMKRIIGYIASGYRKDKIWLRRTKPAKRDYRVLIAVDDSESMQKSKAGDMALRALATLANGMSQLEIGQLGIASFGEDMKLLHPFNVPFTSESGVNIVSNFTFDAKRTRTALCVESSIAALEGASSVSSSMQLVFMISDGRIERDSRLKLRRLIRQMAEKNMLMVMIIVEGGGEDIPRKNHESILNMKEVSFVNGKPKIKHFIEDYPFPYYLVVGDLAALPEILGDALRQWFEMLAQIQNAS
ncbi:hypothetical protein ACHAWF_017951, partial [Thalassiosira exigua]